MIWTTLQVYEARNRTCSNAGVSRYGVRLLSKGRKLQSPVIAMYKNYIVDFTAQSTHLLRSVSLVLVVREMQPWLPIGFR